MTGLKNKEIPGDDANDEFESSGTAETKRIPTESVFAANVSFFASAFILLCSSKSLLPHFNWAASIKYEMLFLFAIQLKSPNSFMHGKIRRYRIVAGIVLPLGRPFNERAQIFKKNVPL